MNEDLNEDLKDVLGFFCVLLFIACVVMILVTVPEYYSSCRESKIFNERYETEYTCGDFFWASSQINQQTQTIKLEQ